MQDFNENLKYFENNYHFIYYPETGKEYYIPCTQQYVCRFCGNTKTTGTFKKKAHAIPELLGNKFLKSKNECDQCNEIFGKEYEDHLAKFLLPYRAIIGIKGKKGVLTYKNGDTHFKNIDNTININSNYEDFRVDKENKKIYLKVKSQPFIPLNVYKAFLKMAISTMPEEWLVSYNPLINFLLGKEYPFSKEFIKIGIINTSGNVPYVTPGFFFLKRKRENDLIPNLYFVLIFGNYIFQILLPSYKEDSLLFKNNITFKWLQVPQLYIGDSDITNISSTFNLADFSKETLIEEYVEYSFNFKEIEIIN